MKNKNIKADDLIFEKNSQDLIQYLDLALEGANLGIWDWNLKDNSVKFDRRWAQMLGLDLSKIEMNLATWESRVHPDDLDKCYSDIKSYMDGDVDFYENIHRMKHNDGHWVYILNRGRFSAWDEEGNPTRFTGTHFDITSSERDKQKLSLFFENLKIGYAFCDMDGKILEANTAYSDILGYTLDEINQLSYWDLTPRKYEEDEAFQLKSLEETGRYGPYKKEYIRKDGSLIPVELNGFIVDDYDGVKGIWSSIEDITLKTGLEREIIRNTRLASIGLLAAGVAHEINNPLTIIKGFLYEMKKKYKDEFFQNRSEKIEKGINRIEKIISGLGLVLDHEKSVRKEFDLFKILDQIILDFSETISDTKIDFKCEIPTGMSYILSGDEGVVYHSFMNLFKNAFHAVEYETDPKISFVVEIIDNEVVLKIRDNGCGISDDDRDKIFDPFYTTKDIHHGTGIGLYVVFNMVKDFSGKITVDSRKDEFTEFTIILPGMINVLNNIKPLSVK